MWKVVSLDPPVSLGVEEPLMWNEASWLVCEWVDELAAEGAFDWPDAAQMHKVAGKNPGNTGRRRRAAPRRVDHPTWRHRRRLSRRATSLHNQKYT